MGTRGAVGFRVDGVDKIAYNHFDSYPDGLGKDVVKFIGNALKRKGGIDELRKLARACEVINTDVRPTAAQKKRFEASADLNVSERSLDDWYCLLRNLQGDLGGYLKCGGIPGDGVSFLVDSLFCEWAYVVNLDDATLEVYKGFQDATHRLGRYCDLPVNARESSKYYPVALAGTFPLNDIPRDWAKRVDPDDEEAS